MQFDYKFSTIIRKNFFSGAKQKASLKHDLCEYVICPTIIYTYSCYTASLQDNMCFKPRYTALYPVITHPNYHVISATPILILYPPSKSEPLLPEPSSPKLKKILDQLRSAIRIKHEIK